MANPFVNPDGTNVRTSGPRKVDLVKPPAPPPSTLPEPTFTPAAAGGGWMGDNVKDLVAQNQAEDRAAFEANPFPIAMAAVQNHLPEGQTLSPLPEAPGRTPGIHEKYVDTVGSRFTGESPSMRFLRENPNIQGPGQGQNWYDQHSSSLASGMAGDNAAGDYLAQFQANRPDISAEPGLGAYYDRAKERTMEDINTQLAARGSYGSSLGIGQLSDAAVGLEAERANREADYNLRRIGEERAWETLGGSLAGQADSAAQGWGSLGRDAAFGAERMGLDKTKTAFDIASTADSNDLARLMGGHVVASTAQDHERTRERDPINDQKDLLALLLPMFSGSHGGMFDADADAVGASTGATTAAGAEAGTGMGNTGSQVNAGMPDLIKFLETIG